jgi:hypothetical protein
MLIGRNSLVSDEHVYHFCPKGTAGQSTDLREEVPKDRIPAAVVTSDSAASWQVPDGVLDKAAAGSIPVPRGERLVEPTNCGFLRLHDFLCLLPGSCSGMLLPLASQRHEAPHSGLTPWPRRRIFAACPCPVDGSLSESRPAPAEESTLKRTIAAPIAFFALVLTAISASADQPVRLPLHFPAQLTFGCFNPDFDVVVTFPVNNEYITIFEDTPTTFRATITGHLVLTYTNPSNGKTLTVNASGPGFDSIRNGTEISISTGLNAGTVIHAGRIVTTIYPDGITFSMVGHTIVDICAALA